MKKFLQEVLFRIPFFGRVYKDYKTYKTYYPPGHYANPFPSLEEVNKYRDRLFDASADTIEGIRLNSEAQMDLLRELAPAYPTIPYLGGKPPEGLRYYFENPMFGYSDGIFLWSMIQWIKPQTIIEVGSGFSSALMLDINGTLFQDKINLTFIEPYPARLKENLKKGDYSAATIFENRVQDIEIGVFSRLKENDILFLDTSHIFKTASDLNYEIFDILPSLAKGVYIHIHDIFYPFEYPEKWIVDQKGYNEIYLIRSFLMYNDSFEIVLFPNQMIQKNKAWFETNMPLCLKDFGGSLWLRKIK